VVAPLTPSGGLIAKVRTYRATSGTAYLRTLALGPAGLSPWGLPFIDEKHRSSGGDGRLFLFSSCARRSHAHMIHPASHNDPRWRGRASITLAANIPARSTYGRTARGFAAQNCALGLKCPIRRTLNGRDNTNTTCTAA
jgi:hypothetical protein